MISIYWFRRDLRINDNTALYKALEGPYPVLPIFIFDPFIIEELPADDARIAFIYQQLERINLELEQYGTKVVVLFGNPAKVWEELLVRYDIKTVYWNRDYEPYARIRDNEIMVLLEKHGIGIHTFKDQVIFEGNEVTKDDGTPYTVYTPYKNKWLKRFEQQHTSPIRNSIRKNFYSHSDPFPSLDTIGFQRSSTVVRPYNFSRLEEYAGTRDIPSEDSTSYLGPHLRFGTVSIRKIIDRVKHISDIFISELIWREFFMQILYHFPDVITENFHPKFNGIQWRNNEDEFERWCQGTTGYPLVDAGMRQLNETGFMHNRVRMVTASFLCKHLLIDWRWGEAYFATKLLDYELSSNNGNWQWAAGTGCDAAPYFRVFNPSEQQKKFDKNLVYIKKWVPEIGTPGYPEPVVDHKMARERAIDTYKRGIQRKINPPSGPSLNLF